MCKAIGAELVCSSATGEGVEELVAELFGRVPATPEVSHALTETDELADFMVYRPQPPDRRRFRLLRDDGTLRIGGRTVEALAAGLDPEDPGRWRGWRPSWSASAPRTRCARPVPARATTSWSACTG